MFNIDLPPNTKDIGAMWSYLFRMVQQLNTSLNSLNTGTDTANKQATDNAIATVNTSVTDIATKAARLKAALANGSAETQELFESLSASIFASMSDITSAYTSAILQTQQVIESKVAATYAAKSSLASIQETLETSIAQTASDVTIAISEKYDISSVTLDELAAKFSMYFDFGIDGLVIGKTGEGASPIATRITNDRQEWIIAGTDIVLVYIDGNTQKLHVNMAEVDMLSIGGTTGHFDHDFDPVDGMTVKWRA